MVFIGPFNLREKAAIVAVILENPLQASKQAAEMGADILEIRLDLLKITDADKAAKLIQEIKSEIKLPVMVTNRSSLEGGKWQGKEEERIKLLLDLFALGNGPDALDIELSADKKERDKLVKEAKNHGKTVIISFHDFSKTPSVQEMKTILNEVFMAGADIAKLAVMPNSMRDVLELLGLALDFQEMNKPICTISMGAPGKHTRVIAPLYGSVLTYASVEDASSAAPGQLPVAEVKKIMGVLE